MSSVKYTGWCFPSHRHLFTDTGRHKGRGVIKFNGGSYRVDCDPMSGSVYVDVDDSHTLYFTPMWDYMECDTESPYNSGWSVMNDRGEIVMTSDNFPVGWTGTFWVDVIKWENAILDILHHVTYVINHKGDR